jgi:hypothetical protein
MQCFRTVCLWAIFSLFLAACGGGSDTPIPSPVVQDDDNDGVNNDTDSCPNTPSGTTIDAQGCEVSANRR